MDFGMVGLDGLVGSSSLSSGFGSAVSDPETKQKLYGSGLFRRQEGPVNDGGDDDEEVGYWKSSKKTAKTSVDDLSAADNSKSMSVLRSSCSSLFSADSNQQQNQMLSFSCPKSHTQSAAILPCFQPASVSPYSRNAGCNSSNSGTYNGFTPSQWIELEHQALIYKYISANMPIPSNLLLPIRKAFESAGLSCLRSNALGWEGFHLGFSGSTDPEPGRCRRTDGKKWRCSREAVADQKYCERHMNRGRHRSRKPVEGQVQGHSSTAAAATAISNASAAGPTGRGGTASKNSFALSRQQLKDSTHNVSINGVFLNENMACDDKPQGTLSVSMLSSGDVDSKPGDLLFISKHQNPFEETSHGKFGFVSSDSQLNPSCGRASLLTSLSDQATKASSHHQLLQFMDNWPRNHSHKTQLSGSSDFLSSMSRNGESTNTTLSPLRLSCESDPIPMGLGVQGVGSSNIPLSWESSIGGPLGEALHSSSQSSPTGVLQKTTFVSMSNSSTGSSPRADSGRLYEGSSFSSDWLGPVPSLVHSSSSFPP